jgi:hypothetical protein
MIYHSGKDGLASKTREQGRRRYVKAYALAGLVALTSSCVLPSSAWKGTVEWPADYSDKNLVPFVEAGAALAAAAAIRELVKTNPHPHLFQGCTSPEQGLDVAVHEGPTPGVYYVMVEEHFDRCGGPRYRVLDWWHVYAVTPQGEVVAQAPPPQWNWEEAAEEPPVVPTQPPTAPPQVPLQVPEAQPEPAAPSPQAPNAGGLSQSK